MDDVRELASSSDWRRRRIAMGSSCIPPAGRVIAEIGGNVVDSPSSSPRGCSEGNVMLLECADSRAGGSRVCTGLAG